MVGLDRKKQLCIGGLALAGVAIECFGYGPPFGLAGDLSLYYSIAFDSLLGDISAAHSQYPPLAVALFKLILQSGETTSFSMFWRAWIVCSTTAAFVTLLLLNNRLAHVLPVSLFFTVVALGGETTFMRFDVFVALLLLLSFFLFLQARYRLSGVFLALAGALKVIPILAVPLMYLASRQGGHGRRLFLEGIVVGGVLAVVIPWLLLGQQSFTLWRMMFTYHGQRGIQVESSWSAVDLLYRYIGGIRSTIVPSSLAWDNGNLPAVLPRLALGLMLVGSVLIIFRRWKFSEKKPIGDDLLLLFSWTLLVSPVLSPQYFLWLLPISFGELLRKWELNQRGPRTVWLFVLTVLIGAFTQWIYPLHYIEFLDQQHNLIICLFLRTMLLLSFFIVLLTSQPSEAEV